MSLLTNSMINDASITTPQSLDEYYILNIYANMNHSVNTPNDFVLADTVHVPLVEAEISFDYNNISEVRKTHLGTMTTNIFYPVGQKIFVDGRMEVTITSYSPLIPGKVKVLNGIATPVDTTVSIPLTKPSIEYLVREKMSAILQLNKEISALLPGYSHDWMDYTKAHVDKIKQYDGLKDYIDFDNIENQEFLYRLEDLRSLSTSGTLIELQNKINELRQRYLDNDEIKFIYEDNEFILNSQSYAQWFLTRTANIDAPKLLMEYNNVIEPTHYGITTEVTMSISGDERTFTFTPIHGLYNYKIVVPSITSVTIDSRFEEFTVGAVTFTVIDKSTSVETDKSSVLIGMNNVYKFAYALTLIKRYYIL